MRERKCQWGIVLLLTCLWADALLAIGQERYVAFSESPGAFALAKAGRLAPLCVDARDHGGVVRAVRDLQADLRRVTGRETSLLHSAAALRSPAVIIGTVGKSALIDALAQAGKIDTSDVAGKWEASFTQVVSAPFPGVEQALVICGSDKRGTIFGIYDLSERIGVSPWYYWADVPAQHREVLYVKGGRYVQGPPAVKYRGIFLNDEAPALSGWVGENFGKFNGDFYTKVFELILRMKGNFLWPAMWGRAFNEDDPNNPRLADEYGIVISTSHHEPMMRAHAAWQRHGEGPWDYSKNAAFLRQFWSEGVERTKDFENIITLAMRGDGDRAMSRETNTALLEKIVKDQREIIREKVNPDLEAVPQVWALYKEVQGYYERGMRVPDDVTLLWCDDNWGNIRRLPTPQERSRKGGAGIYYHFDYVGGPRNYKWINTNPIAKVWEQMNLAFHHDANRIWIVNVGDLKPMEFPIEYFLTLAWDPLKWPKERTREYTRLWAAREFGPDHASEIADIVTRYALYNGRRKPELLSPEIYSLVDYHEADRVVADYRAITEKAERLARHLPETMQDAFFQLVLHPAKASLIVNELYVAAGKNKLYAEQGRASAGAYAEEVKALFQADADLTDYYHKTLADGKWNHMMAQTHIGYRRWQEPRRNSMPRLQELDVPEMAAMGVAVEGSASAWPGGEGEAILASLDCFNQQRRYIDVFNKGKTPFEFSAKTDVPWLRLSETAGTVSIDRRIWVSVDWAQVPKDGAEGVVTLSQTGAASVAVTVPVFNPSEPSLDSLKGFVEADGYVSIEAEHYSRKNDAGPARWEKIDDYGKTLSAMSVFPVDAASVAPPKNSPSLEYQMYLFSAGEVEVSSIVAPTLNFVPGRGLRFAVSMDDETPQIITAVPEGFNADNGNRNWEASVRDSCRWVSSKHTVTESGLHTLKIWMVDPGIVLQKFVVDTGGLKPSYLGPPESPHGRL